MPRTVVEPPKGCTTNADCQSAQVCERTSGSCVGCLTKDDCEFGMFCVANKCSQDLPEPTVEPTPDAGPGDGNKTCSSDADCSSSQKCDLLEQKCVERTGGPCTLDKDCRPGQSCENSACQAGQRDCSSNPNACQIDYECRSGLCYPKVCQDDKDCQPGQTCDKQFGRCSGTPQDCTTTGCPTGQTCNATTKQCENTTPQDCTTTGCPTGQTCNATTKKCENTTPQDCTTAGCPTGQTCNATTKQCEGGSDCTATGCATGEECNLVTKKCEKKQVQTCTTDNDCTVPSGTCNGGNCMSCATQFTCPGGKACDTPTGRCIDKPCSSNAECNAPTGTCSAGKCVSCSSTTCPTGQQCNATTGICEVKGPTPCTTDADCGAGQACQINQCAARATICFSNFQCGTSYFCSSAICLPKACGSGSNKTCPAGQTCTNFECKSATTTRKKCGDLFDPPCSSGTTCLTTSKGRHCYNTCTNPGGKCSNGLDCLEISLTSGTKKSFCFFPASRTAGQKCEDLDTRCVTGTFCRFNASSSTSGTCFKSCTGPTDTACGTGNVCTPISETQFSCAAKGTGKENASCGWVSNRCDEAFYCQMGSNTATAGKCLPRCTAPGAQSTCVATKECLALYISGTKYGICLDKATRTVGQSCGGSTGTRCVSGLTCTTVGSAGVCLKNCTKSTDCRTGTGNPRYTTCRPLTNGGGVCYTP